MASSELQLRIPPVIIASVGRSGTMAIARNFGLAHEPWDFRYKEEFHIENLIKRTGDSTWYGEVGHHIIQNIPDIKREIPNALYIHSVRNGREVITSFLGLKRWHSKQMFGDIISNYQCSEFEKLCYMWKEFNELAEQYIPLRVRFEDYSYALEVFNKSGRGRPAHKKELTSSQEDTFWSICGETMERYGYT